MESPIPDHKANLIAFLFCRDVIVEKRGGISPFRLIDGLDININVNPETPGTVTLWQTAELNVFVGLACYGMPEHEHQLRVNVFTPQGEQLGEATHLITPGGPAPASYRNINLGLPGNIQGDFRFELWVDGEQRATAFFAIKHVFQPPSWPPYPPPETPQKA
jgi:hypothetical protein